MQIFALEIWMEKTKIINTIIIAASQLYSIPLRELSINEAMIPFSGRHNFVQFMPLKPIKYGLIGFLICEPCLVMFWIGSVLWILTKISLERLIILSKVYVKVWKVNAIKYLWTGTTLEFKLFSIWKISKLEFVELSKCIGCILTRRIRK